MQYSQRILILLFSGVLLVAGNVVGQNQDIDRIILKDGSTQKGRVSGYTVTHYLVTANNEDIRVPAERVRDIQFGDTTSNLASLEKAFIHGRYKETISYEQQVRQEIKNGPLREIHTPRVSYFVATSHFRRGKFDQALNKAKNAIDKNAAQPWFEEMARIRLLSYVFQQYDPGNAVSDATYEQAGRIGNQLIEIARGETEGPDRLIEALQVLRVQALEELGEGSLSITKVRYENLNVNTPALKTRLFAGQQRCQIRQEKELKGVLEAYNNRIKESTNGGGGALLQAGKWNAKGALALTEWREKQGETSLLREALLSFVRAHLFYPGEETSDSYFIQHRQSLYNTIRLYQTLADNGSEKGRSYYKKQARKTLDELRSRYPGVPEVLKAEQLIGQN